MRLVLLILMLSAVTPSTSLGAGAAQVRSRDSSVAQRYRALVDAYRAGDGDAPVKGVLALDRDVLDGLVNRYVGLANKGFHSDPALDQAFFRAAAMLHADAAFRCWDDLRVIECGAWLDMGRRLVDVSERPGARAGSFVRRWYAATALVASRHLAARNALEYFEGAVKKFPDEVPLLTAAGWFAERLSNHSATPGSTLVRQQETRRIHQRTAERFLRAALDADPDAAEASLRLARIEIATGRDEEARTRLTALVAGANLQPSIAYLARLTLGAVHERHGETAEAESLYHAAITLDPIGQSARIAMANLLYAKGDSSGAADVVEPFLARTTKPERNDPWSDYQLGYPAVGRLLLDELREEVRR